MNASLEIIHPLQLRANIRYALFDFDGTLSLIREGWQDVMIPMMVDLLKGYSAESERELTAVVTDFVTRLTGKQTIFQMTRLAEEIRKRGGEPLDAHQYKELYNLRLLARIQNRLDGLRNGTLDPEDFRVPGARAFLEALHQCGVRCYLASGTDDAYVQDEVSLLGLRGFFDCVYGARDDAVSSSKKVIIQRIIRDNQLNGQEFVGFGDGFVEIEDTKSVGGVAIGIASNEETRDGINPWKRERLIQAGADVILPDFRAPETLLRLLFPVE